MWPIDDRTAAATVKRLTNIMTDAGSDDDTAVEAAKTLMDLQTHNMIYAQNYAKVADDMPAT